MPITANSVVSFHYRLLDETGQKLENSHDASPMLYLHGRRGVIPGLEKALEGRSAGDSFSVTLAPRDAYGVRVEGSEQRIPIKHLRIDAVAKRNLKQGMVVAVQTDQGSRSMVVTKVGKFNVDMDTNHPLAGKTLTFEIAVVAVREASADELAHGHVHGDGGCHH